MNVLGLEVLFGEGATWTQPARLDLILSIIIVILVIFGIIIGRMIIAGNKLRSRNHQLFLYRCKLLDLTNYQFKTINGMAGILNLKDPNSILTRPALFESAIGAFLDFLKEKNLTNEEMTDICKDMVVTYEKIYHKSKFKTPLEKIADIETNILLCFIADDQSIYIARIVDRNDSQLTLQIVRKEHDLRADPSSPIKVYLWRSGDAEYVFDSHITEILNNTVRISIPQEFTRGKEAVQPYVEVMVPCVIATASERDESADYREIQGSIIRINEHEAHLRTTEMLNYDQIFFLNFTLGEFNFQVRGKIIGDKPINETSVHYANIKFIEMSPAGHMVLKKYISERLQASG